MLVAIAAASPSTTRLPLTKPWANIPVSIGQEIKGTGNPSLEPRRHFPNSFHHFSCAPIRFSLHQGLNQASMRIRLVRGTAVAAPLRRGISRRLPALPTDLAY